MKNYTFEVTAVIDSRDILIRGIYNKDFHVVEEVLVDGTPYMMWNLIERGLPPEPCLNFEIQIHKAIMQQLQP